jgi:dTDP-4-amino-4,6-dideoxygalactose transaminase
LPMLTIFKDLNYDIDEFPVSKDTFLKEISLPIYPQLTDIQLETITSTLINVYKSVTKT